MDDLEALIKQLGLRQFHLFGQSFGGILGYEFLKRIAERKERNPSYEILSFCMSSSPSNVMEVEEAANSLLEALLAEDPDESTIEERFQSNHICRSTERPQPLIDAYAHAGTIWRGSNVIADYVAQPPMEGSALLPPTMVMRGEFDFVTSSCLTPWKEKIWNHGRIREKVLTGCAHHGLLENGQLYGDLVDSFFTEYDP